MFRYFDPQLSDAPKQYHRRCQPIIDHARALLPHATRASIFLVLRDLSRITSATSATVGTDSNQPAYISHALKLRELFQKNVNDELLDSKDVSDYYSVIALALVGYIAMVHRSRMHAPDKSVYDVYIDRVCEEAERCIAIAKNVHITDSVEFSPALRQAS